MKVNKIISGNADRLSLVEKPANQGTICNNKVCNISGDTITSVVLKSNQKIYRSGENERFIYFDQEQVQRIAHQFLEDSNNNQLSLDHQSPLEEGIKLQESYVSDGDWVVKLKIEDANILDGIKKGTWNGISLEGLFKEQTVLEFETKNELITRSQSLDEQIKNEIFDDINV